MSGQQPNRVGPRTDRVTHPGEIGLSTIGYDQDFIRVNRRILASETVQYGTQHRVIAERRDHDAQVRQAGPVVRFISRCHAKRLPRRR